LPLKDTDADDLDAGWDDPEPVVPPGPRVSVAGADDLEDLDAGWDDGPVLTAPRTDGQGPSPHVARVRTDRLSKRERRAFERKKRALGEKRRAERRAEEKSERREKARRAAEQREAERRGALARAERSRSEQKTKRSAETGVSSPKEARPRRRSAEPAAKPHSGPRQRFTMPNGGWIIVVIALITLATAWYAFGS
jgi:cobalamin biosynthesis Mg chelatase CobN